MPKKIIKIGIISCLISCVIFFISCKDSTNENSEEYKVYESNSEQDYESSENANDEITDGTYCAEVEYYNPNTGTRHSYDLDVEVENGELVQIDWPNGGWLDESHFVAEDISSGSCSFTSDQGYEYTVTLGEKGGGCGNGGAQMQQQIQEDEQATICPRCGNEKDPNEDYCDDCQRRMNEEQESQPSDELNTNTEDGSFDN